MPHTQEGFTAIEVLVVLAIIGIMTIIGVASFTDAQQRSRDSKRVSDVASLMRAIEVYRTDHVRCPLLSGDGVHTWSDLAHELENYITLLPTDPSHIKGAYYVYGVNGASDSNECVVAARLENHNHEQLAHDEDALIGVGADWRTLTTHDVYTDSHATLDCADSVGWYCIRSPR